MAKKIYECSRCGKEEYRGNIYIFKEPKFTTTYNGTRERLVPFNLCPKCRRDFEKFMSEGSKVEERK